MDRLKIDTSNITSIVACVFIAAVTFIRSRCLATKGGTQFTEPLPKNDGRDTHRHTDQWKGFINNFLFYYIT
jgi:hypothetical protein